MTTTPVVRTTSTPGRGRRWPFYIAAVLFVSIGVGGYLVTKHWPYRYRNVEPLLEKVFASHIAMDKYHRTYFPNPGFVATGLTLRRNSAPDLPPVGSAQSLRVEGRWSDLLLFRRRVHVVDVEGLHVVIPPVGSEANKKDFPPGSSADFSGPETVVEQFNIHNAKLDIMRANGSRYTFPIRQLVIRNLRKGQTISYEVDMQNAMPVGHILSTGSFGPLIPENLGATPVNGQFTFSPVNLADIHGIRGTMTAAGKFYGSLAAMEADANVETPDFAVGKGRATHLSSFGHGTINCLNANLVLHKIEVQTGSTKVNAKGTIVGSPKVTNFDIDVSNGRAQDLLRPFLHDQVPVTGAVWLHSHAYLAPAKEGVKFLQRLAMDGAFNIPAQHLTDEKTQHTLSTFSERAQGMKTDDDDAVADVLSSLGGQAKIRNGIVSTQRMAFKIPGAGVDLNGTFNLYNQTVHMLGNLRMDADISHAATGWKSVLLKPLVPFFKKENAGAVVPIAITGGPHRYKVSQNILHRK